LAKNLHSSAALPAAHRPYKAEPTTGPATSKPSFDPKPQTLYIWIILPGGPRAPALPRLWPRSPPMWSPGQAAHREKDLRGATKHETTSAEVLRAAKEERARRKLAKDTPRAALTLQRVWRGRAARATARAQLRSEWIQQYGALASRPDAAISSAELAERALPLALAALLPPPGPQRAALEAGGVLPEQDDAGKTCLRGTMLLLLKALAPRGAGTPTAAPPPLAAASASLLQRTATLCCSIIGSGVNSLTQTAAARVLALLTVSTSRSVGGGPGSDGGPGRELRMWLGPLPMVPMAAHRLLLALADTAAGAGDAKQAAMALANVVSAQLSVIDTAAGETLLENNAHRPLELLVRHILAGPDALARLAGTPAAVRLGQPAAFCRAAACAATLRDGPAAALRLLTALTSLFVGKNSSGEALTGSEPAKNSYLAAVEALIDHARSVTQQSSNEDSVSAALEAAVRLFGDGGVSARLAAALPLPSFCALYCALLDLADGAPARTLRLLSALAFGAGAGAAPLLPRLWRWLAMEVGLPLEVAAATSQFDVPSLPRGVHSVPQRAQQPFSLFCRAAAHYLSATDDTEFYGDSHGTPQGMFSVEQYRAVAAGLTTLVFRTHLPLPSQPSTSSSSPSPASAAILLQHAPRLLRALYDRDARRPFCSPGLWLGPYRALVAAGTGTGGIDASGAAVLRAMVAAEAAHGGNDDAENVSSSSPRRGPGSAASPTGAPPPLHHSQAAASPAAALAALLLHAPQCIPFEERVEVFRGLVSLDKQSRRIHLAPAEGGPRPLRVTIRRARLLEDAAAALLPAGSGVRGPLGIQFMDSNGMVEAGVDMGGLTKELLDKCTAALVDPNRGLFAQTAGGALFPHPLAPSYEEGPALLKLSGLILGKALYEGVLLPAPLAPFFVARLQGRLPTLDDLAALDPVVYKGLVAVKTYGGDASTLGLDFTIESDAFGAKRTEELVPGGADVAVTDANKLQYVHLVADWHLRRRLGPGAAAFAAGLGAVLPLAWLRLFSAREVNQLLGGGDGGDVDVEDLRKHCQYSGGYSERSRPVQLFWQVLKGFSPEDRRALLRFATSSSRPPLGGFAHLTPPFTLHRVDGGGGGALAMLGGRDVDRLPTASTCANTLKLPTYRRESTLREKLLYAIRSGAGFDLS
jgi:hypothetical protein